MKIILISLSALLAGCNIMPFLIEEVEEIIKFEIEENDREIELREIHHNIA